jgi:Mn2+/Fe2+ NRAMP family transporter
MEPISTEAALLVAEIEARVVNQTVSGNVKQPFWFPAKFLLMGISEKFVKKPFELPLLACMYALFMLVIFSFFFQRRASELPLENVIGSVVLLVLLLLMVFLTFTIATARPSKYGDSGDNIADIITHLDSQGFKTEKEIELLKKSVKPFEDQTRSRVTALKWIVNLIWAGFTYTFVKIAESSISSPVQTTIVTWGFVILPTAYVLVWGYEAAVDRLFRTIEFGFNDFCQHIETPKGNS